MDDIKKYIKGMPKWGWFAIGGAVLLILFFTRSRSVPAPSVANMPNQKVGEGEVAGQIGSMYQQLEKRLAEGSAQNAAELKKIRDEQQNVDRRQTETFFDAIQQLLSHQKVVEQDLNNQYKSVVSYMNAQTASINNQFSQFTESVQQQQSLPKIGVTGTDLNRMVDPMKDGKGNIVRPAETFEQRRDYIWSINPHLKQNAIDAGLYIQ